MTVERFNEGRQEIETVAIDIRCGHCCETLVNTTPAGGWVDTLGEVRCPTFYGTRLHDPFPHLQPKE